MENAQQPTDKWASGGLYEPYVGRWSRLVARQFVSWLSIPANSRWLDVGCGTGALSQTILQMLNPTHVDGIDQSDGFIGYARETTQDPRVSFRVGDAQALPVEDGSYDAAVSGLMLNFVPQPELAVREMARAVKPGGTAALYVWDYAGKMQMMRHFWNAAAALDPNAVPLDEGRKFPICQPQALTDVFQAAGLNDVETRGLHIETDFKDFDDFWTPFLSGQAPAPSYTMSLTEDQRAALRERLRNALPFALDGSIPLVARAWAVQGKR